MYQEWHENGQKKVEVQYKNGYAEGMLKSWDSNGQKCDEIYYVNGQEVKI